MPQISTGSISASGLYDNRDHPGGRNADRRTKGHGCHVHDTAWNTKVILAESGSADRDCFGTPPNCSKREKKASDFIFAEITPFHVHLKTGLFELTGMDHRHEDRHARAGVSVEIRKDSYKAPGTRGIPGQSGHRFKRACRASGDFGNGPKLKLAEGYAQDGVKGFCTVSKG